MKFAIIIPAALILTGIILLIIICRQHRSKIYNELLKSHSDTVNDAYEQMREWRHDYKSQLQTMKTYMAEGRYDLLDAYLDELNRDLVEADKVIKSGNAALDAVINTKLSPERINGIQLTIDARVPELMHISDVDICKIASNLLDNAVEAAKKCTDGFIRVYIGTLKGQLYLSVLNSTDGNIKAVNNGYATTKSAPGHGVGIKSITRTVKKYGGWIEQKHDEDLFSTEILIPLRQS